MDKILRGNEFLREQNESKREKYKGERERTSVVAADGCCCYYCECGVLEKY
jgi:hypothetical protein